MAHSIGIHRFLTVIAITVSVFVADWAAAQQTIPPDQAAATELYKEGVDLLKAQQFGAGIEKFKAAYALYPDPSLLFFTAEAFQLWGNWAAKTETQDALVFEQYYPAAIENYKKFVAAVSAPDGKESLRKNIPEAEKRITELENGIASYQTVLQEESLAKKAAAEAEQQRLRQAAQDRQRKLAEREATQLAVDGLVLTGVDSDLSAVARMVGGALLGWDGFAFEGHVSIDGFLPISGNEGTSATSLTLLDLGVRWGLGFRHVGLFGSAGASYGIFFGKPRERKITDNAAVCGTVDTTGAGDCTFSIDANIATRVGLGYGFQVSEKTTVAVRLDLQYLLLSVDDSQPSGSPPARLIGAGEKNQFAFLVGLEFMRWR